MYQVSQVTMIASSYMTLCILYSTGTMSINLTISVFCTFMSAITVLCLPLLCSVATCTFLIHSYVTILVVTLKTLKTLLLLLTPVVDRLLCATCLLLRLSNTVFLIIFCMRKATYGTSLAI